MLHLAYVLRPTAHARAHSSEFWAWLRARERWFYDGLSMVRGTSWYVCTVGADVHCIEHHVTFDDEAAWGAYRRAVAARSADAQWERRRTEQELWYEIVDARLLNDPPVDLGMPATDEETHANT